MKKSNIPQIPDQPGRRRALKQAASVGMLAAAVGQLAAPLALPLNTLNACLLGYVGAIAHTAATVPHAEVRWRLPGPLALAAAYAAIAALIALVRRRAPPAGDRW